MRSNRPSCMAYDEEIRFEATVKIHSKLFNRSREVSELSCIGADDNCRVLLFPPTDSTRVRSST